MRWLVRLMNWLVNWLVRCLMRCFLDYIIVAFVMFIAGVCSLVDPLVFLIFD